MGAAIYSYFFDMTSYSQAMHYNTKQQLLVMSRPDAKAAVMVIENKDPTINGDTNTGSYDSIISSITSSPDKDTEGNAMDMSTLHTDDFFT